MTEYDPRLVELYDDDNPDGPDHDFYRELADEMGAQSIVDIGCGTGILTVSFARPGRTVVGIDPSPNMLAYAANRPDSAGVRWILGDSRNIPRQVFDYAVMTGNVAQHIPDTAWERTLSEIRDALRKGGILAFECRNPRARAWEAWSRNKPTTRGTAHGPLREWMDVRETGPGQVLLTTHSVFEAGRDHIIEELTLAFRECELIQAQLRDAGFSVSEVWGSWDRIPWSTHSPVMIFEARRG